MSILDEIRSQVPGGEKLTDAEIVQTLSDVMGKPPSYVAMHAGLDVPDYIPNDGLLADTLADLGIGATNLPAIPAVLSDFGKLHNALGIETTSEAPASEAWDDIARSLGITNWQQRQRMNYSPERKAADRELDEAKGVLDTVLTLPGAWRAGAGMVAQSVPGIGAGALAARGLSKLAQHALGPRAAQTVAGTGAVVPESAGLAPALADKISKLSPYLAEGAVIHGMTSDQMMEQGADPRTALDLGFVAGATGGLAGLGVSRLAGKLGFDDATAALAGQRTADAAKAGERGYFQRVGGSTLTETAQEAIQSPNEQMWTNMATDRPLTEGLGKSAVLGAASGAGMGLGLGGVTQLGQGQPKITPAGPEVSLTDPLPQIPPAPVAPGTDPASLTVSPPAATPITTATETALEAPPEHEVYKWMPDELRPLAGNTKFPYKGVLKFNNKLAEFDAGALQAIIEEQEGSGQKRAPVKLWLAQRRLFEVAPDVAARTLANDPFWGPFMAENAPPVAARQDDPAPTAPEVTEPKIEAPIVTESTDPELNALIEDAYPNGETDTIDPVVAVAPEDVVEPTPVDQQGDATPQNPDIIDSVPEAQTATDTVGEPDAIEVAVEEPSEPETDRSAAYDAVLKNAGISERMRRAFIALEIEKQPVGEYAAQRGIKISTAKNHYKQARDAIAAIQDQDVKAALYAISRRGAGNLRDNQIDSRDAQITDATGYGTSIDVSAALADSEGGMGVQSGLASVHSEKSRKALIDERAALRDELNLNPTMPEGKKANHRHRRQYAEELLGSETDPERREKLQKFIDLSKELDYSGADRLVLSDPADRLPDGPLRDAVDDAELEERKNADAEERSIHAEEPSPSLDEEFVKELTTRGEGPSITIYRGLKRGGTRRTQHDGTVYPGDFFTEDAEFAKKYAGKNGRVVKRSFKPRKVFDVEEFVSRPQAERDEFLKLYVAFMRARHPGKANSTGTLKHTELYDAVRDGVPTFLYPHADDADFLMSQGYDSIRARSEEETDTTGPLAKTWFVLDRERVSDPDFARNRQAYLAAREVYESIDADVDLAFAERLWNHLGAPLKFNEVPENHRRDFAKYVESNFSLEGRKNVANLIVRIAREKAARMERSDGPDVGPGRDAAGTQGLADGDRVRRAGDVRESGADVGNQQDGQKRKQTVAPRSQVRTDTKPGDSTNLTPEADESRGGQRTGSTVDQVRVWLGKSLRSLGKWVNVRIVPNVAALRTETGLSMGDGVRGLRHGGHVYLVADMLDAKTAREVFAHEVVGHLGLETVLGQEGMTKTLDHIDGILASGNKRLVKIAARVDENYPNLDPQARAKEILAHLVEQNPGFGLVQQIMAKVRSWLANHGIGDMRMAAVQAAIVEAARAVQTDDVGAVFTTRDPQFSQINDSYNAAVNSVGSHLKNGGLKAAIWLASTEDLADLASGVSKELGDKFKNVIDQMMRRAAKQKHRVAEATKIAQAFSQLNASQQQQVNKYLLDSTWSQKWGYLPDWDQSVTVDDVDATFKARFDALNDEKVQEVIKAVNRNMAQAFHDKVKLVEDIAKAHNIAPPRLAKMKGPYSPIKRFGDHVVTGMSRQLIDAIAEAEAAQKKLDQIKDQTTAGSEAAQKKITKEKWAEVKRLRQDADHYFMDFVDGYKAAVALARQLETRFARTSAHVKAEWRDSNKIGYPELNKVRTLLEDKLASSDTIGKADANAVNAMLAELELGMLSREHSRQTERERRKIAGMGMDSQEAPRDMMKAFSAQAIADAHYLSNLEHSADLNAALRDLTKEAETYPSEQRHKANTYVNELWRRYHVTLDYKPTPLQDKIVGFNAAWNLVLSPIYYVQNGLQNFMMTLPYLAKSFGYTRSWGEFYRAYKDASAMVKAIKITRNEVFPFDVNLAARTQAESDMLQWLLDRGRLDIALGSELGDLANGNTDGVINKAADYYNRTFKRLPGMLETVNRVTTALAAHRLAMSRGATKEQAQEYADRVIRKSHGNYESWNTPRLIDHNRFGGWGKVLFQYRKFQLIQGAFLVSMVHQMVNGKDSRGQDIFDDNTKLAAWKGMGFTMAHALALGGSLGLPGVSAVFFMYQLAMMLGGGDDEPYDKDSVVYQIRKGMANLGWSPDVIDLVLNGIPTIFNTQITDQVGWANMLSWAPYVKFDTSDQAWYEKAVVGYLGPTAMMGRKLTSGAQSMFEGDYLRGLEKLTPNGVNNFATLIRTQTKGETHRNGDQALAAEEFGAWEGMMSVLGLPSERVNKRWQKQAVKKGYEGKYEARTGSIKKRYAEAVKEGDGAAIRSLRKEWLDLQTKKRKEGFAASPLSVLLKSPREQRKREKNTAGGVKYDKGNKTFVRNVDRLY